MNPFDIVAFGFMFGSLYLTVRIIILAIKGATHG